LLPTGRALDQLEVPGLGVIEASMVDAANPVVFVAATALGLSGTESPAALSTPERLAQFEDVRAAAALAMGLVRNLDEARTRLRNLPQVGLLAPPQDAPAGDGSILPAASMDILARMISAGQPHKATPLTGAMCLAVAARVPGSLVQRLARPRGAEEDIRVAHPSGILPVTARTRLEGGALLAEEAVVYRTARRLMEGRVLFPG
jgi:2-methylaconitate cis-trans-isomerase PrpF